MSNAIEISRTQFEAANPIPFGIFWSEPDERYMTSMVHLNCLEYQGKWLGWQSAILAAPVVERQDLVAGRRERFQKWVMATKHPVLGFLDGHWLERGDDREGYANEYVQGLWGAFKEFAEQPAPGEHE